VRAWRTGGEQRVWSGAPASTSRVGKERIGVRGIQANGKGCTYHALRRIKRRFNIWCGAKCGHIACALWQNGMFPRVGVTFLAKYVPAKNLPSWFVW